MFLLSHPNRTEHVFQHPVCCPLGIESIDEASYSFMGSTSFDPWQGVSVEEPTPQDGSGHLGAKISQLNCVGSDAKRCQEISGLFMSGGRGCQTSRSPPCRPGRELELKVTWELPRVGTRDGTTIHQNLNQKNVPSPNWKSVCSFPSSQIDAPAQVRDFDEIATNIDIWHLTSELTRWGHCGWWWRGAPVWCRRSQKTSMDDQRHSKTFKDIQRHSKTINSDHWQVVWEDIHVVVSVNLGQFWLKITPTKFDRPD